MVGRGCCFEVLHLEALLSYLQYTEDVHLLLQQELGSHVPLQLLVSHKVLSALVSLCRVICTARGFHVSGT